MKRIPEADLMDDPAQARAYAAADFSQPHDHFIELLRERQACSLSGPVLDLGCGPGDICLRFARAFPDCVIHAVDGAQAMLQLGEQRVKENHLEDRIKFIKGYLPEATPPRAQYDCIISNSLLHHLQDPATLWETIGLYASQNCSIFIMDLLRPDRKETASMLVDTYAGEEAEILRRDFYNSLCAAYTPDEVRQQLQNARLDTLSLEIVSDRHWIVSGKLST